jgi:LuxR family maltose regulon positive regulatory protein
MPRRAPYFVRWSPEEQRYEVGAADSAVLPGVTPGETGWFAWLDGITSFAFYSSAGVHCTMRKETIQRGGAYWYAYRSVQRRTVKHYIGRTIDLSVQRLEEVAERCTHAQITTYEQSMPEEANEESSTTTLPPLLEARLHPPRLAPEVVERPQLFERLDTWRSYKLTLLCAPAGFGKTTLVNSWLSTHDLSTEVAWVSLDAGDNDPARFWRCVFTACQSWSSISIHYTPPLLLSLLQMPSLQNVLISFLNAAGRQEQHHLLVLDDYHVISESLIHETLNFCLAHLPETLHILLMTRSEHALSLGRLRAGGEINEIQVADLRFSQAESAAFLQQKLGFPLSPDVLVALDMHLEGWIAGLRLLVLALQGQKTQEQIAYALSTFRGSHRSIRDYFVSEVLRTQPEPLQRFLLLTSLLPRLNPSLCAAVTGQQDAAVLLETVERANVFLEALDGAGEWYRYHAFFADAMQHEARRRLGEDELIRLAHIASCWLEEHGLLADAIEAGLKSKETERVADLIERYVQVTRLQKLQEYHTLHRWLTELPEAILMQSPALCLNYAVTLIFNREGPQPDPMVPMRVKALLQRAEERWRADENRVGLGQIAAFRAFFTYEHGERKQAVVYARQALSLLPATEALWRGMSLGTLGIDALQDGQFNKARSLLEEMHTSWQATGDPHILEGITMLLGIVCFVQGELHQAIRYFRMILDDTNLPESRPASLGAHLGLAQIYYEWNDLTAVKQQIQATLDLGKQFPTIPPEVLEMPIAIVLACMQHIEGETELAIERLTKLLPELRSHSDKFFLFFYQEALSWLVRLSLAHGDQATAQDWVHDFLDQEQPVSPVSNPLLLDAPADPERPVVQSQEDSTEGVLDAPFVFQEQRALLQARLLLAQGDAVSAVAIFNNLLPSAQSAGRGRSVLQMRLLLAQAYAACARREEAQQMLLEALKLGYIGGYLRLFLDEGEELLQLLQDLMPSLRGQPLRGYAQSILQAVAPVVNKPSLPVVVETYEPLSMQEQRVLRLLAAGLSNIEIARELVVSINTVRSQVQSIYRKLQVHNRHAASAAARSLHLL